AAFAAQNERHRRARVARHVEHELEARAGAHRELVAQRLERLARLPVDRDDNRLRPGDPYVGQSRGRRVAEPKPDARARTRLEAERRGGAVGEHEAALSPRPAGKRWIGEIVLDLAALVEAPVRKHHRDVLIGIDLLALLDNYRPEQTSALLAGVG